jgi:large subunit ribosomal protein L6
MWYGAFAFQRTEECIGFFSLARKEKKHSGMTLTALYTERIAVHAAITMHMRTHGVSLQGPLGMLHLDTALYDPQSVMALKHVHDEETHTFLDVSAPSKHLLKTFCSLFTSAMEGVTQGFMVHLEAVGVGYKMQVDTHEVLFRVGLSHPVSCMIPPDIKLFAPKPTQLLVFGIDKQRVRQIAAQLRAIKVPEPYKGKGLRRKMEAIVRKEGKKK